MPLFLVVPLTNQGVKPLCFLKRSGNITCTECLSESSNSCTCLRAVCALYISCPVNSNTTSVSNFLTFSQSCNCKSEKVSHPFSTGVGPEILGSGDATEGVLGGGGGGSGGGPCCHRFSPGGAL